MYTIVFDEQDENITCWEMRNSRQLRDREEDKKQRAQERTENKVQHNIHKRRKRPRISRFCDKLSSASPYPAHLFVYLTLCIQSVDQGTWNERMHSLNVVALLPLIVLPRPTSIQYRINPPNTCTGLFAAYPLSLRKTIAGLVGS